MGDTAAASSEKRRGAAGVTVLVLVLFALILVGGFAAFLTLELIALNNKADRIYTLSTYVKAARRRAGLAGAVVLFVLIWLVAVWLSGHLVFEWW